MTGFQSPAIPLAGFARLYIEKHGLALVKLPPGKKYPTHEDWEQPGGYFTDAQQAHEFFTKNPAWGVGAVLGPSKLCSLDIDNLEESRIIFSEFGIDIDALADEHPTIVGNPARFRIEFRAPDGIELSTHRVNWPDKDAPNKRHTVFELRAGLVQDVLPPTIHPDFDAPYQWRTMPKNGFHALPDMLLRIWRQWEVFAENARKLCPWDTHVPQPPKPSKPRPPAEPSVIEQYNAAHSIEDALEHYGYKRIGKRFLSPHSKTGLPGCNLLDGNRVWIHHASDPLGGEHPINPFDLFLYYEHNNDLSAATRAAAQELGIAHKTRDELRAERAQDAAAKYADSSAREVIDPETGEILTEPSTIHERDIRSGAREIEAPFKALGYDHGTYYYLAAGTQQITGLTAAQHSKSNFIQLAPLTYWEREYPTKKGADWDIAADALMRQCEKRGVFSPNIMRGRGAWYDDGRVMVHLGDRVLVDGKATQPGRVRSRFVYEARLAMRADISNPLTAAEASKFTDLVSMASWEKPIHAMLAAGWCAVAHIGGVLNWRPHIWVIGRRGSGKTYVMSKMLRPVLGDNVLHAQGDTSEAGLRQTLGIDALPVLFDEAEGTDAQANDRVQAVLSLVRQSSSETGGKILKGTTGGKSMEFIVRSCFAFSSINANIIQQSDRSRVTVLELNQDKSHHVFEDIVKAVADLLTDEYIQRFYARSLMMAATIRQNAISFAAAAAAVLGEQRAGDQIGTLLAGVYSLQSDEIVTAQQAVDWVESQDWSEQQDEVKSQSDEHALWQRLMQAKIRVMGTGGPEDFPVGLLIKWACGEDQASARVGQDRAQEVLIRSGFKIGPDEQTVIVSNTHNEIKHMLQNTPWAVNWGRVLRRLPGAETAPGVVYFGFKGSESRAVSVPINAMIPA